MRPTTRKVFLLRVRTTAIGISGLNVYDVGTWRKTRKINPAPHKHRCIGREHEVLSLDSMTSFHVHREQKSWRTTSWSFEKAGFSEDLNAG